MDSESTYQQLKRERDNLDRENLQLHEKNGDLDLQVQTLSQELQQAREEIQSLKQALTDPQTVDVAVQTEQGVHSLQPQAKKLTVPNLDEIRDRILETTRSDQKKAATRALDKFIAELNL